MSNYVELSQLTKIYPSPKGPQVIVKDFDLNWSPSKTSATSGFRCVVPR